MKKIVMLFIAMGSISVFADTNTFDLANYPVVKQVRESYKEFEWDGIGGEYRKSITFWRSVDESTKRNYLEQVARIAEEWNGKFFMFTDKYPALYINGCFPSGLIPLLDERLSAAGAVAGPNWAWNADDNVGYSFPKCTKNWWDSLTDVEKRESMMGYKYLIEYKSFDEWPVAAFINHYNWAAMRNFFSPSDNVIKIVLLPRLQKAIKRRLREQGKTFFVDEETGKNPVQEAIDEFMAAIDNPRWMGVDAFVAKWWPEYEWTPVVGWPSDETVNAIKMDIYYGEKDLDVWNRRLLRNNLGIEKYNEFIEFYNK